MGTDFPMDLTGATMITVQPGDTLTFVVANELAPWNADEVHAHLRDMFPGLKIQIISSCTAVLYEPKPE